MRIKSLLASSLVLFVAASCGENAQPGSQTSSSASSAVKSQAPQPQSPVAVNASPQAQAALSKRPVQQIQSPIAPPDARWTYYCDKTEGPTHVAEATILKSRLAQLTGLNDWYVIHTENESSIYYGYYRSLDIPAEKKRAEADRAKLAALSDARGNPVFRGTILVPIVTADPEAPADWNLLNAPPDAYWTIEIATFAGDAQRKAAAVQYVRELREKGEKDAYYYHGPTASSVCIGAWKRSAVAEQGTGINKFGQTRDDAHTSSPDQPLLVLGDVVPPNMPSRVFEPGTGKAMTVMAQKLEILDPDMKQKAKDFPEHMVNYSARGVEGGPPDPSVLVVIPHDQSVARQDDWLLNGGPASASNGAASQRPAPSAPGDNVLRSLGDH